MSRCASPGGNCVNAGACNANDGCTYEPTPRERRRQARALWEKACATMDCNDRGHPPDPRRDQACWAVDFNTVHDEEWPWAWHEYSASALLDGLACEDLP